MNEESWREWEGEREWAAGEKENEKNEKCKWKIRKLFFEEIFFSF